LRDKGIAVIYDDRDMRPGQKFGDADLMGIPYRIVVSNKTVESSTYELKSRTSQSSEQLPQEEVIKLLLHDCEKHNLQVIPITDK